MDAHGYGAYYAMSRTTRCLNNDNVHKNIKGIEKRDRVSMASIDTTISTISTIETTSTESFKDGNGSSRSNSTQSTRSSFLSRKSRGHSTNRASTSSSSTAASSILLSPLTPSSSTRTDPWIPKIQIHHLDDSPTLFDPVPSSPSSLKPSSLSPLSEWTDEGHTPKGRGRENIALTANGEAKSWWGGVTPTMPKKPNREKTIFDVSKVVDTGIFALQGFAPQPEGSIDGQGMNQAQEVHVNDAPLPDDSPIIPLATFNGSRVEKKAGPRVVLNEVWDQGSQNQREEFWSAKRLGKRREEVDGECQPNSNSSSLLRSSSLHSRSASSSSTSSITSLSSSRSAPVIPARASSRKAQGPPVPPSRGSSLNDPIRALTTPGTSVSASKSTLDPLRIPVVSSAQTTQSRQPFPLQTAYTVGTPVYRQKLRRRTTSSTVSSLPTVIETPSDSSLVLQEIRSYLSDLPIIAPRSRLYSSYSSPDLNASGGTMKSLLGRGISTTVGSGLRKRSSSDITSSKQNDSDLLDAQKIGQIQLGRPFMFKRSHKKALSESLLLDEHHKPAGYAVEDAMVQNDLYRQTELLLASSRPTSLLEDSTSTYSTDIDSLRDEEDILAMQLEAQSAILEAESWSWPNPPPRLSILSTSISDSTLGGPVTPQSALRQLSEEAGEELVPYDLYDQGGVTPRPRVRDELLHDGDDESLDIMYSDREYEYTQKRRGDELDYPQGGTQGLMIGNL